MKRTSIVVVTALLTACSHSTQSQTAAPSAPSPTASTFDDGACTTGFVEILPDKPACGIALEADGSLTIGERRTPPIVASYQEGIGGQIANPAREIILFPPAPQSGLRIVQACETADPDSLCWAVRLLDPKTAALKDVAAGKYGPAHWISWAPKERRTALISHNEGAEWLHVVDTESGTVTTYPDVSENANWQIDRDSFAWNGDNDLTLKVKTCETCAPEARSFTLP
jgi:hypothetical protein